MLPRPSITSLVADARDAHHASEIVRAALTYRADILCCSEKTLSAMTEADAAFAARKWRNSYQDWLDLRRAAIEHEHQKNAAEMAAYNEQFLARQAALQWGN
jgi:hypothetical protein